MPCAGLLETMPRPSLHQPSTYSLEYRSGAVKLGWAPADPPGGEGPDRRTILPVTPRPREARTGLAPWNRGELPAPPDTGGLRLLGVVGPGAIVLGASIGSG